MKIKNLGRYTNESIRCYSKEIIINSIAYRVMQDAIDKEKFVINLEDKKDNILKHTNSRLLANIEFNGEKMKCHIELSKYPIGNIYEMRLIKTIQ